MTWQPVRQPTRSEIAERRRARRGRFLVDESLGRSAATALNELRYNTLFVGDVGLNGRDDADVLAYAWRTRRILLTHDRDFLDNRRFPESRNPGLAVILAGADGNQQDMIVALGHVIGLFGHDPEQWRSTPHAPAAVL